MGIPKQSTSKILPKPMAPPNADQKSKTMTHNIHVSQLHHVHQTQYFNEWVGLDHLNFKLNFYRGQNSSKNTLTAMEIVLPNSNLYRPIF